MRTIVFQTEPPYNTAELIKQVVQLSPTSSINVEQMRLRCKILDALDGETVQVKLEEMLFDVLSGIIKAFPFNVATPALLRVIDGILNTPADPKEQA